jgi:phage terminase small subunit
MSKTEPTAKQRKFAEEYLKDCNATQAAIRAGYSEKSAEWIGPQLLGKTHVATYLSELRAAQTERTGSDADRIKEALRAIAFSDQRRYQKWGPSGVNVLESSGLTNEEAMAVAEVSQTITDAGGTLKIRQHDKLKAIELLAKMEGLLRDKVEVTTPWDKELAAMTIDELRARADALRAAREKPGQ